ncbi:MAG: virulence RhuM family protein [Fibromonadales bacterium]|nr:virulence RhuM family protein [Fibromonadales bacterium]
MWLSQAQMAELFQTSTQNITQHIKNIYSEGELEENTTCKDFLQVVNRGFKGKIQDNIKHYCLELIITVGYRVKSRIGTQFRRWATEILLI